MTTFGAFLCWIGLWHCFLSARIRMNYLLIVRDISMGTRWLYIIILFALSLTACNLGSNEAPPTAEFLESPTPEGVPEIRILSPVAGDEYLVGDEILVSVVATDSAGVTRVQLLANNQIVKSVSSESLQGDLSMTALLDYTPQSEGSVTLRVLAYRGADVSSPADVQVEIRRSQAQITATPNQISNIPDIPNDGVCRALINVGLNFREGPSTDFERIRVLGSGTLAPIVGRIGDNSWWQLNSNNQIGWVSAEFTTEYGICSNVPLVAAPTKAVTAAPTNQSTTAPTLTPVPTATSGNTNTGTPDLIVAGITGDKSIIVPSGVSSTTESYKVTIRNTGTGSASQFTTTMFVNGTEQDLGVIAGLPANATQDFNVQIEFNQSGTYKLEVVADSDSQVTELSEVNNRGEISVSVAFSN